MAEELESAGVRLHFVTEDFEDSAVGKFIRSAKAFAAEVEREKFRLRSRDGKVARARAGRLLHGKTPVYGYEWTDETRSAYAENPGTAPIVRRIFADALAGKPTRRIATELTDDGITPPRGGAFWDPASVSYILTNQLYIGEAFAFRTKRVKTPGRKWGKVTRLRLRNGCPCPPVSSCSTILLMVSGTASPAPSGWRCASTRRTTARAGKVSPLSPSEQQRIRRATIPA